MEITLRGLNLGNFGLDMSALLDAPQYYGVPYALSGLAYIIEHARGPGPLRDRPVRARDEEWPPEWKAGRRPRDGPARAQARSPAEADRPRARGLPLRRARSPPHRPLGGRARLPSDADVEIVVHEAEYRHVRDMPEPTMNFFNKVDTEVLEHVSLTTVTDAELELLPGRSPGAPAGSHARSDGDGHRAWPTPARRS